MPEVTRQYAHDCDSCRYLGAVEGPDPRLALPNPPTIRFELWVCGEHLPEDARRLGLSVIARRSSTPEDYTSTPVSMLDRNRHPALMWAGELLEMERHAKNGR